MAIQSRERLKGYFKKGAYPTEGEFGDLIESMRHRGESVPLAEVSGLAGALNRKLERSEAGVLRDLLDRFRGFGALAFSGIDEGERRVEEGVPGRMDTAAALTAGSAEVWFNTVEGRFLLRLDTTAAVKYFALWGELEGRAGVAAESSAAYADGRLFMATASGGGRYYTWGGDTGLRELGDVSDITGALDDLGTRVGRLHSGGVLTGSAPSVEHKARSAKIVFETLDAAGRHGQTEAVIGAVGVKAGLMLPEQAENLGKLVDADILRRLTVLPFKDEITAAIATTGTAPSRPALEEALAVNGVAVRFAMSAGRFVLAVSTGSEATYHTAWPEVVAASGEVVAPASANYVAGKAFVGSNPKRYYTWNGIGAALKRLGDDYETVRRLKAVEEGIGKSSDLEFGEGGALALTERARRAAFDDLWRHAWDSRGGIDEEAADGRRYLGNGLAMTYGEALEVLTYGKSDKWVDGMFSHTDIRTNIPHRNFGNGNRLGTNNLCCNCHKLEVFVFDNTPGVTWFGDTLFYTFSDCRRLRAVKGMWKVTESTAGGTGSFSGCAALEEIDGLVLGPGVTSLPLADSPLISRASLAGIVSRSLASHCVITLHADPYAKVCGDTENAAAAALSAAELAEWTALADAAAGKNITFARH